MTPEIISHIRQEQEYYDRDPERYEREQRRREEEKAEEERQEYKHYLDDDELPENNRLTDVPVKPRLKPGDSQPHDQELSASRKNAMPLYSDNGLTSSPQTKPASPAVKTLRAALMSRSWMLPHSGHIHSRTIKPKTICALNFHLHILNYLFKVVNSKPSLISPCLKAGVLRDI